ncbi:hypothetical protein AK812_SmicGene30839 [Symbiodinium microadriaticum]|uniref:Reverse transcriptase domain-containing protein n=1 Tax=Symbiodinium microadriaticum TaxID=2951 RepID=A0A1Q9CY68_SYMMI|nr:hypothetical protein AK812_SmicGene30839 [Symbiodinium microadriaticum]
MMGEAYRAKCAAIESDNVTHMIQAASYFTEVTGALGARLAIVKGHEKLPQDPALATTNKHEAQQKLDSFLREARDLGINHCGTSPFLVIMAPANCMALDFVIFCPESGSLVAAVQVKSNTLRKQKDVKEQSTKLHEAAETVRQRNVEFLAVLGSNFPKGFIDDLFSLQQEDLVALIPPFLRHLSGRVLERVPAGSRQNDAFELLTDAADVGPGLAMARLTTPVSGGMTEALAASVRAALSLRPRSVLLSLDGRSACDSVSRAAFLRKLQEVAPELLTFVRLVYGQPSSCYWWDAAGACRTMPQGEGCKHGDALAPARFALGQHETLCRATPELHQDDALLAFLDDLYVVTCGIASNSLGVTSAPPGISELGEAVWRGDKPSAERGLVVSGTLIGHSDIVAAKRMQEERKLLQQLPEPPDLQCSWLLLLFMCASPRANHALCTLPPRGYAALCATKLPGKRCRLASEVPLLTMRPMLGRSLQDQRRQISPELSGGHLCRRVRLRFTGGSSEPERLAAVLAISSEVADTALTALPDAVAV